jgi:hypothetical protein
LIYAYVPVVPDRLKHFKVSRSHKFFPDVSFFFCKVGDTVLRVFGPGACSNPTQDLAVALGSDVAEQGAVKMAAGVAIRLQAGRKSSLRLASYSVGTGVLFPG